MTLYDDNNNTIFFLETKLFLSKTLDVKDLGDT